MSSTIPKRRQDMLKWCGWGYKDSRFYVKNNEVHFTGNRYPIGGDVRLPEVKNYVKRKLNIDVKSAENVAIPTMPMNIVEPNLNIDFISELKRVKVDFSTDGEDRLFRSHGQTMSEMHLLKSGNYGRIPDVVLWPTSHEQVVEIVKLANELNVVVIPFGGGTSVTGAAACPQNEHERCISVLDTSQMNRMLWLDEKNLVACFESGIIGQDLEMILSKRGLTLGHEPDSHEFSTLGGWVATRASGMKKNFYGNIEDLVIKVKMVTTKGVLERNISAPRVSCGPDFNHIVLGSEGSFGVITEVVLKVRPLPEVKKYGSLVFPDFSSGVKCMREIAKRRCQPASIRLIDNEQFAFGNCLKAEGGFFANLKEKLKVFALTRIKGYDLNQLTVATLVFEGDKEDVEKQESLIYKIAEKYSGFAAGAANGQKGYTLTYVVAYIRDFIIEAGGCGESFETSVPWDKCEQLCNNVKMAVDVECKKHGIVHYFISCRVTQTYDAGACVYFYLGFPFVNLSDPIHVYEEIENSLRDEILNSDGSISHHHGVGKIRARWYKQSVSNVGVKLFQSTKLELDPKNIFATGNFLMPEDEINFQQSKSKL